jgi:hypothetical protein
MTQRELKATHSVMDLHSYLENCRDDFASASDAASILCDIKLMNFHQLLLMTWMHALPSDDALTVDQHHLQLVQHLCREGCELVVAPSTTPRYSNISDDSPYVLLGLIDAVLARKIKPKPARRMLTALGITFNSSDTVAQLRSHLKMHATSLRKDKCHADKMHNIHNARQDGHLSHIALLSELQRNWPQLVPHALKDRLIASFREATSSDALREHVCAVCAESKNHHEFSYPPVHAHDLPLHLLRRDCPDSVQDPFSDDPTLSGAILEPAGVVHSHVDNSPFLCFCNLCYTAFVSQSTLPCHALANDLYLGPVPDELKDLTVVEEAMIAQRWAKCWVIHLCEDGDGSNTAPGHGPHLPTTQQGMKGHIIVYPSKLEKIGHILPPSISDVITPICVVFVGSQPPSAEWLWTKAKPLIVWKEKVWAALVWLKANNPLYSDVIIDHDTLNNMLHKQVAPVEIAMQNSTTANEAQGPQYDFTPPNTSETTDSASKTLFKSVIVSDIEGHDVSTNKMSAAALRHLRKGGGFVEIQHDPELANEYEDEELFPLLYPTLFPYGCGAFELMSRSVPISMKTQVQHFFSLTDRQFQEHYSFLFTVFNILQWHAVSLQAKLKVSHSSFSWFVAELASVSEQSIHEVIEQISRGDSATAYSDEEHTVLKLMREVTLISSRVPGTGAAHTAMRNEIRGMMMDLGLLSFYITINPADVYNPIVKFLAGADIDIDNLHPEDVPDYWDQAIFIAKNPFIAAKFFNI